MEKNAMSFKFCIVHIMHETMQIQNLNIFLLRTLASYGKTLKNPLLKELAKREEANKSGKMTVMFLSFNILYIGQIKIIPRE